MDVIDLLIDIIFFLNSLKHFGKYEWKSRTFNFSSSGNENIRGFLTTIDPELKVSITSYEDPNITEEKGILMACVNNLIVTDWSFSCDYEADIAINNKIPIYGEGTYKAGLSNIIMSWCYSIPKDANQILDIDVNVQFKHGPASLSGIWYNPDLAPIISAILTQARLELALWNTYEPACIKNCILNPVIFYLTNFLIYDIDKSSEIQWKECKCVQDLTKKLKNELKNIQNGQDLISQILPLIEEIWQMHQNRTKM